MSNMKKRYWDYMWEVRFAIFYLDLYADKVYKKDMMIKIFCVFASLTGIAAWEKCKELAILWSIVIMVSQVLNAVKKHLPYSEILKNIKSAEDSLKFLYDEIEYNWFRVESGKLSDKKINKLLYEYKKEYIKIESQLFENEIPLIVKRKIYDKAEQKTEQYLDRYSNKLESGSSVTN